MGEVYGAIRAAAEQHLADMRQAIDEVRRLDPIQADLYEAHYAGMARYYVMVKRYVGMEAGDEKEALRKEIEGLAKCLEESLPRDK